MTFRTAATTSSASASVIFGIERQRDRAVGIVLRVREHPAREPERLGVERMQVHGAEVDADADVLRLDRVHDRVAIRGQHLRAHDDRVQVVCVRRPRPLAGSRDFGKVAQPGVEPRLERDSPRVEALELLELRAHERRLQVEHVVLVAGRDDVPVPVAVGAVALPRVAADAVQRHDRDASAHSASLVVSAPPSPLVMFFVA